MNVQHERDKNNTRRARKDATGRPRLGINMNGEIYPCLPCGKPTGPPILKVLNDDKQSRRLAEFMLHALADDVEGLVDTLLEEKEHESHRG